MITNNLPAPTTVKYSIDMIRDEVRQLLDRGFISRHQPIYVLCQYIPPREWLCVECELEKCDTRSQNV